MNTTKDLNRIEDYVQNYLVSLIKKIHSDFEVPLAIHRDLHNSLYCSIQTQTPITPCFANCSDDLDKIRYSTCNVNRVDIATSNLIWYIPEYLSVVSPRSQHAIEKAITNPMNFKDLSIQFIDTNKSMLVIGNTRIDKDPFLREVIISTRIGLGISYKLKEKIQSHCRQKCDKFMRCILRPEECNLALVMEALGSKI